MPKNDDKICQVDDTNELFTGVSAKNIDDKNNSSDGDSDTDGADQSVDAEDISSSSDDASDNKVSNVHAASTNDDDDDDSRYEDLEHEKQHWFIATIAMGALSAILIVIVIVMAVLSRRDRKKYTAVPQHNALVWNSAEKAYDDPFDHRDVHEHNH